MARRDGAVMAAVLCMGTLMSVFAGIGFVQVRATGALTERVRAQTLIEDLGRSAIEEACAALEGTLEPPALGAGERDLGSTLAWPSRLEVPETMTEAKPGGATVSPVSVRSSAWVLQRVTPAPGFELASEVGVIELTVRVKAGGAERAVVARRYASTVRRHGEQRLRVRIASEDLYLATEAP